MTLTTYEELEQGSNAWLEARRGLITASELNLILTPNLKIANNDKTRAHAYELAAQRITGYTEPKYIGDNALRGWRDEITARELYSERFESVYEIGGMCRDFGPFRLWASPDGLVWDYGGIEVKSRIQKHQLATIITGEVPKEHILQVQANLMVSGRDWWDYVSFCGGMPLWVIRVLPDAEVQEAITTACEAFEGQVQNIVNEYNEKVDMLGFDLIMTERAEEEQEIYLG